MIIFEWYNMKFNNVKVCFETNQRRYSKVPKSNNARKVALKYDHDGFILANLKLATP